jgi:hypothetical protein
MRKALALTIAAALAVSILTAMSSAAAAPPTAVVKNGHCSAHSTWRLTLKKDHARIEADVEVQSPRAAQRWRSRFSDNGIVFARVTKTTIADGSFSATRFASNKVGSDLIRVRSVNLATGEVCRASATF